MLLNSVKYKARLCTGLLSNTPCAPTWPPHTRVHANRRIYLQLLLLWTLRASLYLYWRGIITICEEYRLQWLQLLTQHTSIVIYCSTGRNIVSSASPSRHIYPAIACLKPFCSEMRFSISQHRAYYVSTAPESPSYSSLSFGHSNNHDPRNSNASYRYTSHVCGACE